MRLAVTRGSSSSRGPAVPLVATSRASDAAIQPPVPCMFRSALRSEGNSWLATSAPRGERDESEAEQQSGAGLGDRQIVLVDDRGRDVEQREIAQLEGRRHETEFEQVELLVD